MARHSVGFAGRHIKLPRSRRWRIVIGIALILGGFVGFLPILGFWMIPLGLAVLSIDLPSIRRHRRRAVVWWGRRRQRARATPRGTADNGTDGVENV
jgi:fatty acid desaturase